MQSKAPGLRYTWLMSGAVLLSWAIPGHTAPIKAEPAPPSPGASTSTPPASAVNPPTSLSADIVRATIASVNTSAQLLSPQAAALVPQFPAGAIALPETIEIRGRTPVAQNLSVPPGPNTGDPNRDRFLQPGTPLAPVPAPEPTNTQPLTPPPTPEAVPPTPNSQPIPVRKIEVTGSTVFSAAEFEPIVQPYQGRSVTLEELRESADKITQLYLDRGFITSRAVLVDQTITDGIVQIRVVEGGLERIDVEGTQSVNPDYIRRRIELAGVKPINKDRLEDQLRLLRTDPLFDNVEASLRSGTEFGQSILIVRVTEANQFSASISADNFSPPSVGSERLGIGVGYRNLTGHGDQLTASYSRSTTGGANLYDFGYRAIVNPMNGAVQVRYAPSDYRITDPVFSVFGIRGYSSLYEISYRQPLVRTPREEFALSVGFTYQEGQTFLFNNLATPFGFGPNPNGFSRTSIFKFGQDYVTRDPQGAWSFRSQFNFGTGLFGATVNPSPIPDSVFLSWLGQVQRVQILNSDQILVVQADLQLAGDSLLPSQQFVVGGGQSVRGFRQNARSGDNGFRLSVEDRIVVARDESGAAVLQVVPFIDVGTVWNATANPNLLPAQTVLAGGGLGIIFQPFPRLTIRIDGAIPFVNVIDRGQNLQDAAAYFNINYQL